jgi:hypothetical protein
MFGFKKRDHVGEFITGAAGKSVLRSVSDLADHFKALDGWDAEMLSVPELTYLAAFTAWVAVRDDRARFRLTQREAAEVGAGLVQGLCQWYSEIKGLAPEDTQRLKESGFDRLLEYDAMWKGGLEKNDLGAYLLHAFTCVQAAEQKTQDGFIDHVTTFFPQTVRCLDQRLRATL